MNTSSVVFSWTSSLGISVVLFLFIALVYLIIGISGGIMTASNKVGSKALREQFILGREVDSIFFGKTPAQVIEEHPLVDRLIKTYIYFLTGGLAGMGVFLAAITWFGLRQGNEWALWTALIGNAALLIFYWFFAIIPAMRELQVSNYFLMWHPFAFVPTVLVPIAMILGWIGLKNG